LKNQGRAASLCRDRLNTALKIDMVDVAKSIRRGLEDALAYARGNKSRGKATVYRVPPRVDVAELRKRLGLTQAAE
jgi:hypothetical protein